MNIPEAYDYLVRARRDLWAALNETPDEVLSRPLLGGAKFHCIKDMLMHIVDVEDGWIHGDILHEPMVQEKEFPAFRKLEAGPVFAGVPLQSMLEYWQAVEKSTLAYIETLRDDDLKKVIVGDDSPEQKFTVDGLLWHVMIHEMRHTAQICILLRTQGIKPPSLDLLFYLPVRQTSAAD